MGSSEILQAIDDDVIEAAQRAAAEEDTRFVIGWWNDGAERRFMLLPEGHHVTEEGPFLPLVLVTPSGRATLLAA
jgi:hypothetical protein